MSAERVSPCFLLQDELLAELEELEQEELDKNLLEISGPETVPLPNVPSVALPSKPGEYAPSRDTPWHHEKGMISRSADFSLSSEPKRMCCADHDASVICGTRFPNLSTADVARQFWASTPAFSTARSCIDYRHCYMSPVGWEWELRTSILE